jgi:hypothetical protein
VSGRRILALLGAGLALAATPAAAQTEDQGKVFQRYADIREHLYSCRIEAVSDTLTPDRASQCDRLAKRFTLYVWPSENWYYHVHCLRRKGCPTAPYGEPSTLGPMPQGSQTVR